MVLLFLKQTLKRQMATNPKLIDGKLIQAIFLLGETEIENKKLLERLNKSVHASLVTESEKVIIIFNYGTIMIINQVDNIFRISFNKEELYCNEDNNKSKISSDRLAFYLKRVMDYEENNYTNTIT